MPRNSKQICPKRNPMKNSLIILLVLTSALHADKKPKRNVSVVDTPPSTGIKTDVNGHLQVEHTGIVTLTKKGQRASYHIVGANVYGGNFTEGLWTIANPFGQPPADAGKNPFGDPPAGNPFAPKPVAGDGDKPLALSDDGERILLHLSAPEANYNDQTIRWFNVALHKDAKLRFVEPVKDQNDSAKTDIGGHLLIESTGIKTIFVDSWPPSATYRDRGKSSPKIAYATLIIKTLDPFVRSGKIKIKKPPLTPEQRAERARRLLESGAGFIDSNNSSGPNTETEESDNGIRARDDKGKTRIEGIKP
tara:strand:+ start:2087 stop:3004 length:918 start_codon:yes stop_codon:yes gene_type:complete